MMLQAKQHLTTYVASPTLGGTPSPPGGGVFEMHPSTSQITCLRLGIQTAAVQPLPIIITIVICC